MYIDYIQLDIDFKHLKNFLEIARENAVVHPIGPTLSSTLNAKSL